MSVLKDVLSEHLTPAAHDRAARATFPGMAHFAGSGPPFKTCHECQFWDHNGYHAKTGKYHGLIKPAPCRKFRALTREVGDKVPDDAAACRHFEQADPVPKRFEHLTWSP
jgi:hypothetical protein